MITEEARARKRARDAIKKRANRKGVNGIGKHEVRTVGRPSKEAVAALLKLIPPDTRSLTGCICGDPLPGRSALDRLLQGRST